MGRLRSELARELSRSDYGQRAAAPPPSAILAAVERFGAEEGGDDGDVELAVEREGFDVLEHQRQWAVMKQAHRDLKKRLAMAELERDALRGTVVSREDIRQYLSSTLQVDAVQSMVVEKGQDYADCFLSYIDWDKLREFLLGQHALRAPPAAVPDDALEDSLRRKEVEHIHQLQGIKRQCARVLKDREGEIDEARERVQMLTNEVSYLGDKITTMSGDKSAAVEVSTERRQSLSRTAGVFRAAAKFLSATTAFNDSKANLRSAGEAHSLRDLLQSEIKQTKEMNERLRDELQSARLELSRVQKELMVSMSEAEKERDTNAQKRDEDAQARQQKENETVTSLRSEVAHLKTRLKDAVQRHQQERRGSGKISKQQEEAIRAKAVAEYSALVTATLKDALSPIQTAAASLSTDLKRRRSELDGRFLQFKATLPGPDRDAALLTPSPLQLQMAAGKATSGTFATPDLTAISRQSSDAAFYTIPPPPLGVTPSPNGPEGGADSPPPGPRPPGLSVATSDVDLLNGVNLSFEAAALPPATAPSASPKGARRRRNSRRGSFTGQRRASGALTPRQAALGEPGAEAPPPAEPTPAAAARKEYDEFRVVAAGGIKRTQDGVDALAAAAAACRGKLSAASPALRRTPSASPAHPPLSRRGSAASVTSVSSRGSDATAADPVGVAGAEGVAEVVEVLAACLGGLQQDAAMLAGCLGAADMLAAAEKEERAAASPPRTPALSPSNKQRRQRAPSRRGSFAGGAPPKPEPPAMVDGGAQTDADDDSARQLDLESKVLQLASELAVIQEEKRGAAKRHDELAAAHEALLKKHKAALSEAALLGSALDDANASAASLEKNRPAVHAVHTMTEGYTVAKAVQAGRGRSASTVELPTQTAPPAAVLAATTKPAQTELAAHDIDGLVETAEEFKAYLSREHFSRWTQTDWDGTWLWDGANAQPSSAPGAPEALAPMRTSSFHRKPSERRAMHAVRKLPVSEEIPAVPNAASLAQPATPLEAKAPSPVHPPAAQQLAADADANCDPNGFGLHVTRSVPCLRPRASPDAHVRGHARVHAGKREVPEPVPCPRLGRTGRSASETPPEAEEDLPSYARPRSAARTRSPSPDGYEDGPRERNSAVGVNHASPTRVRARAAAGGAAPGAAGLLAGPPQRLQLDRVDMESVAFTVLDEEDRGSHHISLNTMPYKVAMVPQLHPSDLAAVASPAPNPLPARAEKPPKKAFKAQRSTALKSIVVTSQGVPMRDPHDQPAPLPAFTPAGILTLQRPTSAPAARPRTPSQIHVGRAPLAKKSDKRDALSVGVGRTQRFHVSMCG